MHKLLTTLAAVVAVLAIATQAFGAGATVKVADNKFVAKKVHVSKGATVTWKWTGRNPHNVTFGSFHSGTVVKGTYKHRFTKRGTFSYRCTIHSGMTGKVVVG